MVKVSTQCRKIHRNKNRQTFVGGFSFELLQKNYIAGVTGGTGASGAASPSFGFGPYSLAPG